MSDRMNKVTISTKLSEKIKQFQVRWWKLKDFRVPKCSPDFC